MTKSEALQLCAWTPCWDCTQLVPSELSRLWERGVDSVMPHSGDQRGASEGRRLDSIGGSYQGIREFAVQASRGSCPPPPGAPAGQWREIASCLGVCGRGGMA